MLANALFVVAVITLAVTTMLSGMLAMTRASVHRAAQQYVSAGYQRAATAVREAVAASLADKTVDPRALSPLPHVTPLPAACVSPASPCTFFASADVAFENTQNVSSAPDPCDASSPNCAANLESNARVNEGRLAAQITVNVTAPDGTVLATRTQTLTMRTFGAPPYVTIAGARDDTLGDADFTASEGDDGGLQPQPQASACASPIPDETIVRVEYRNASSGACMDGSSWQRQAWSNANAGKGGWSP